ncbi:DUF2846 domain-containing protein [Lysobacter sp. BMK333-48F3]|uniref:DUF2846 domain-containing protein n=1 Tax=Lysobacter sp. BMK333-48F3 TaxID=2867962 RepID=UPI001C8BECA6|nr:DUF2846 domain-containing protein [Lysobacter sp. BMK333-48F3]MBX9402316.1 DUF2846 domain-containing protein [Lysobacter sp. BMK333-48F3]
MKLSSLRVLPFVVLLPLSAAATPAGWNYKAVDPAKQVQAQSAPVVPVASKGDSARSDAPVAAPKPGTATTAPAATVDDAVQTFALEGESDAAPATSEAAPAVAAASPPVPVAYAVPAVSGGRIAPPPAGKGQVVFFRPSNFVGGMIGFKVREGKTELGKLRSGKYFVASVEPGAHEYVVHSETKDVLNLEVEAGETYYVQGSITMGLLVGRPNLSPSDRAAFEAVADKLKLAQ